MECLKPYKSKVQVIRELGYPIISKEKAGKIELLQNPSEKNKNICDYFHIQNIVLFLLFEFLTINSFHNRDK